MHDNFMKLQQILESEWRELRVKPPTSPHPDATTSVSREKNDNVVF